jgi:hypothetical protein
VSELSPASIETVFPKISLPKTSFKKKIGGDVGFNMSKHRMLKPQKIDNLVEVEEESFR